MKIFTFILICILSTMYAFGQTIELTGQVTDEKNGEALTGVSVQLKSTNSGTITDAQGRFSFQVAESANYTLTFSYLGYQTKTITVDGNSTVNVQLTSAQEVLNQLVVVGYGVQKKKDLTGAVSTVQGDQLSEIPVPNVAQALSGKMPGVNITSQDGRPGGSISIRVRGGGSISQSNQPLFIVDGFPAGSISDIPASDIQSISVLKDAASTAIYGARGSHG